MLRSLLFVFVVVRCLLFSLLPPVLVAGGVLLLLDAVFFAGVRW